LLLYASGCTTRDVASQVGLSQRQTRYWLSQFRLRGMEIIPVKQGIKEPVIDETEVVDYLSKPVVEKPSELPFPKPMAAVGLHPEDTLSEGGEKRYVSISQKCSHMRQVHA